MAIKHQYTILCNYLITNKDLQVSFIDIFSNIIFPKLPARYHCYVAVGFNGEVGDEFTISLDGPDGKIIEVLHRDTVGPDVGAADTLGGKKVTYGLFHQPLTDFSFKIEGTYSVALRHGKRLAHRYPFGVFVRNPVTEAAKDAGANSL